jgi:hypothetical protein
MTKELKERLDGYIEHMNLHPRAIDRLSLFQNYAGAFMLAYERGELVVKETCNGDPRCQ